MLKLCGSQFLQKNVITPSRNCFSGESETVFSIYQTFQAVKIVSPKRNGFFFRLVKTNFLSSRNIIVLFRALLKILKFGGSNFFKRNLISARGKCFLASRSSFFFHFQILMLVKGIFLSNGNVFVNKCFIPYCGDGFSNIQIKKTTNSGEIKNNCQAAILFHTFSAVTQAITLHLKLFSLYLLQKCKVNLSPFNLSTL